MRVGPAVFVPLLGCLVAPRATAEQVPHPDPRVIVNVLSVTGPHHREELERFARRSWGRIIRCYNTIDQNAKGMLALELVVTASGKVTRSKKTGSTLKNGELAACLTDVMARTTMPRANGRSTAQAEIHVAPGDR